MTDCNGFGVAHKIAAIQAPTKESEARLKNLNEKKKDELTQVEQNEQFNLSMRLFWNCEC